MNGNQAIAHILKAEGVEWLSAFPNQPLIDEGARAGIRPIICRQERTGVNMADGFSRTTNGRPFGVFTMQTGPGAENALGGAAQAYADAIPLLLLPGGVSTARTQVPPNFDAVDNYRGITKWAANINQVERIPELMRRAFSQLVHGRPGPVLVEIPSDLGAAEFSGDLDYQPVKACKSAADSDAVRDLVDRAGQGRMPGHQRWARRDVGRSYGPARGSRRTAQRARYDHLGRQERVSRKPSTRAGHWWPHRHADG